MRDRMEGADLELQLQEAVKQIKGSMVPAVEMCIRDSHHMIRKG